MPTQQQYDDATVALTTYMWRLSPTGGDFEVLDSRGRRVAGPGPDWVQLVLDLAADRDNQTKGKLAAQRAWALNYFMHGAYATNPAITRPYYMWVDWVGPEVDDLRFSMWRRTNGNRVNDTKETGDYPGPVGALEDLMATLGVTYADILPQSLQ